eukprot:3216598-Karenia_brevis.AAC.1
MPPRCPNMALLSPNMALLSLSMPQHAPTWPYLAPTWPHLALQMVQLRSPNDRPWAQMSSRWVQNAPKMLPRCL